MSQQNARTTVNTLTHGAVRMEHSYSAKPSWKSYGEGHARVEITGSAKWQSVDIHAMEVPEGTRGLKEVYVSIPLEGLIQLLDKVGYTVTKKEAQ